MLVHGHILAMSPLIGKFIDKISVFATTNDKAAALVCFSTMTVALFNWGLGLFLVLSLHVKLEKKQNEKALN